MFKAALRRDSHARDDAAAAAAAAAAANATFSVPPSSSAECSGCSSYLLPVMFRAQMSERLSAALPAHLLPRHGAFNTALLCVTLQLPPLHVATLCVCVCV